MPLPRRRVAEWMDAPGLDADVHRAALRGLARLNSASGSHRPLWAAVRGFVQKERRPIRVLDIATGAGDVPVRLALLAARHELPIEWSVCDVRPLAVKAAIERARSRGIKFIGHTCDVMSEPLPGMYDIVMCSLFLHHLDPPEVIRALRAMSRATTALLLISDLRRTYRNLALAGVASRLLSRSPIVRFDAGASVRGAYTPHELAACAKEAELQGSTIRAVWPQRMLLTWTRSAMPAR